MLQHLPFYQQLKQIYGWGDEQRKGRSISLISALLAGGYNVFITGIFYTGFLSMYGIDLVSAGIISFIPYLGNCFSIFSPMVLERIKKRKWILVGAKIYFYFMYIIATTLMPLFVTDPDARVTCFVVILFLAYSVYAIFSPGFTPWFYFFYPEDQKTRAAYISYNQIISSVFANIVMLLSGLLTKVVSASAYCDSLILGMRYLGFALVLADVFMQSRAKEYPYPVRTEKVRLREVFTLSLKYKKFMGCMLLMFVWNYNANLNNGLWNYHLLNTVGLSYSTITTVSAIYPIILFLLTPTWRKVLSRYSWIRTFAITILLWAPTELLAFCISPVTKWMYPLTSIIQNTISVGMNLSYANIFYMNLPRENATTHTCFQTVFCNLFAFLGLMTGTVFCNWFGSRTLYIGSLPVTSVQFTTIMRSVTMIPIALVVLRHWRGLTPDDELEALDLANGKE